MAVMFVVGPFPEYPVKPQNTLESCCTERQGPNELVAPRGKDELLISSITHNKKRLWLCRGHGRVFYVNTCTLTGNIFFQRIICMS
jgi:hypothetical protein